MRSGSMAPASWREGMLLFRQHIICMETHHMERTYTKTYGTLALALAVQLYAGVAVAAPPANVVGTWTAQVNQDVVEFTITNQGGGAGRCKVILGQFDVPSDPPIRGFYCPGSGEIEFRHNNASTGATVRTFSARLSDTVTGEPDKMGGTVTNYTSPSFGPLGIRNFSATKQ
jgi:hypothetical protein